MLLGLKDKANLVIASALRSLKVGVSLFAIGAVATAAQLNAASPPMKLPTDVAWLIAPPNPWVLLSALFSAVGAVSAVLTFFQPKPYLADQGKSDRDHINKSFHALYERMNENNELLKREIAQLKSMISDHALISQLDKQIVDVDNVIASQNDVIRGIIAESPYDTITTAARSNLLSLQATQRSINKVRSALISGLRINYTLEEAGEFFRNQSFINRSEQAAKINLSAEDANRILRLF